jgi:hypothetical protein
MWILKKKILPIVAVVANRARFIPAIGLRTLMSQLGLMGNNLRKRR